MFCPTYVDDDLEYKETPSNNSPLVGTQHYATSKTQRIDTDSTTHASPKPLKPRVIIPRRLRNLYLPLSRNPLDLNGPRAGGTRTEATDGGDDHRKVAPAAELPPQPRLLPGDARHGHRVGEHPQDVPIMDHHGIPSVVPHWASAGGREHVTYKWFVRVFTFLSVFLFFCCRF